MDTQPDIQRASQSLEPGDLVAMYLIDLSPIGTNQQYAFCPTGQVVFNDITYVHLDVETEGWEWNGQGTLPQPKIRIVNATKAMSGVALEFQDLIGAKITRIRTYRQFLDGMPDANPAAMFSPDIYVFEQKTAHNKFQIEWTLSASMDQQGVQLPGRLVIRDYCLWRYRVWNDETDSFDYSKAQCPYTGVNSYDLNGIITTPDQDRPSRKLDTCCKVRFGSNAVFPFAGFPGAARTSS